MRVKNLQALLDNPTVKNKNPGELAGLFLEATAKIDNKPFSWYPFQSDVMRDQSRFIIVNKARQIGMTRMYAGMALGFSLMFDSFTTLFLSSGQEAAKRILGYSYDFLDSLDSRPTGLPTENKGELRFNTGSRLISLPNNPRTARGIPADLIIIDEFAHFTNDQAMMAAIGPSISRGGALVILSTPWGRSNLFFDLWHNDEEYSKHELPWFVCPDPEYRAGVERLKLTMPAAEFSQEYLCSFQSVDIQVFHTDEVTPCVDDRMTEHNEPLAGEYYRFGIDFGRRSASTVVTIVGVKGNLVFLRRIIEMAQTDYTVQVKRIVELEKKFKPEVINVDATGVGLAPFDMLRKELGSRVVGNQFTRELKAQMVGDMKVLFQDKRLVLPRNKKLISQLLSLERQFLPRSDSFRFKHPLGEFDDYVWSLGLAILGMRDRQRKPFAYKFVGEDRVMTQEETGCVNSRAKVRYGGVKRVFF